MPETQQNTNARSAMKRATGHVEAPVPSFPTQTEGEEWGRLPKPGALLSGLGRSYLFQLCTTCAQCGERNCNTEGHRPFIRSVVHRLKGKKRGVRLVCMDSIREFIADLDRAQNPQEGSR